MCPVLIEYLQTSQAPRVPTLFVSSFLLLLGSLGLIADLVLGGKRKSRHEASRLAHMRHAAVRDEHVRAGCDFAVPVIRRETRRSHESAVDAVP